MKFKSKAERERIIALDWETYWATDYSLSIPEYNTSSYVRDPQFMPHCVSIKIGSKKPRIYRGEDMEKALRAIDWTTHALLAQNTSFDGYILAWHYGIVPCFYLDTMSMTRGLHNEMSRANLAVIAQFYGIGEKSKTYLNPTKGLRILPPHIRKGLEEGCILDTQLCYDIAMRQLDVYPQDELELIDLTIRMFCTSPLQVNLPMAKKALQEEMFEKRNAILKSGVSEDVLQSNPKFATALIALGVDPPQKISTKTGYHSWSFSQQDDEFMDLLDHENLAVRRLIEGRLAAKSTQMETRANRLIQAGNTGGLPVGYNYYAAKTGRWGGTNKLNLQNLPRVDPDNPQASDGLRRSIQAPPGHVLVVCDSGQIEARTNAWQAGQFDLLDQFRRKEDPYCIMASDVYGRQIIKTDKLERFVGKTAILGLGYQMGAPKFQTTLAAGINGPPVDLELHICQRIVDLYRIKNSKIVQGWNEGKRVLLQMCTGNSGWGFGERYEFEPGVIWLPNGMPMNYPGIMITEDGEFRFKSHGKWKKIYGGLTIENLTQALARIIVGLQILHMRPAIEKLSLKKDEVSKIVMITHDEGVACVPVRHAKQTLGVMIESMRWVPPGFEGLPLNAEGGFARNYSK